MPLRIHVGRINASGYTTEVATWLEHARRRSALIIEGINTSLFNEFGLRRIDEAATITALFRSVLQAAAIAGVMAVVALEDENYCPAMNDSLDAETDVVRLVLERVEQQFVRLDSTGLLIADRPGGGSREAGRFVARTLDQLSAGTDYVAHKRLGPVFTADSRHYRLLQVADIVAAGTTAMFAGETRIAPLVFAELLALMPEDYGRRGGYGIKVQPGYRYLNLYHWLLGDAEWVHYQQSRDLPLHNRFYALGPDAP